MSRYGIRRTKIIATLGPATDQPGVLPALVSAGVDVVRLNFSHGTQAEQAARVARVRELENEAGRPIGVLQDLQGPKLRIGTFADPAGVVLNPGDPFRLTADPAPGDETRVGLSCLELFGELAVGQRLLLADGALELRVTACDPEVIETVVVTGGRLTDRKGVNVPDADLSIPALTVKDLDDLAFGVALGVDWVALSFVQRADDLVQARQALARLGSTARLIAKIEKPAAVRSFDDILGVADGVMVARGDLGVELPQQTVPVVQKAIVRRCVNAGTPVVVATQMLESMIGAPRPTRAEASDVANAIYDGADAVMLSGETAVGAHPVEAVAMMDRIALAVEDSEDYPGQVFRREELREPSAADAVCAAACRLAELLDVRALVGLTRSGSTARRLARYRTPLPILATTPSSAVARQLAISWGVIPRVAPQREHIDEMVRDAVDALVAQRLADPGDTIVLTAGAAGDTNLIRVESIR